MILVYDCSWVYVFFVKALNLAAQLSPGTLGQSTSLSLSGEQRETVVLVPPHSAQV